MTSVRRRGFLRMGSLSLLAAVLAATPMVAAAEPAKPNILFAIADDMGHASAYGTPWVRTPNFDRLAAQGILFTNFYTPCAKCSPSRACILTGRNPWQNGEAGNHWAAYPKELKSWMEALSENGYFVGSTGKTWGPGTIPPERENLGGKKFDGLKMQQVPAQGISPNDYTANFKAFLAERPGDRPFCFWYGSVEPHRIYEYGAGVAKGGHTLSSIDRLPAYWPDTEAVRNDLLDYAFEVEYFDRHLGSILAALEEAGLMDNTLIVVTSDNGPPFPRMKGHPYEQSCRMPTAAYWKKGIASPGRTSAALCSFIDFAPTFLEVAGVDAAAAGMQPVTGRSLADVFAGGDASGTLPARAALLLGRERNDMNARPGTPSGLGYPVRALRQGNYLYLHNFEPDRWPCGDPDLGLLDTDKGPTKTAVEESGESSAFWKFCFGKRPAEELYNVAADPDCVKNLAASPEYAHVVETLRGALFAELKRQRDPRMSGQGDVFDNYLSPRPEKKGAGKRAKGGSGG